MHVGAAPISEDEHPGGHIDSPWLDIKQNPLSRANDRAFGHSYYYGHQELLVDGAALSAARSGGDHRRRGDRVNIGDDPATGVLRDRPAAAFGLQQMDKKGAKRVVEGEGTWTCSWATARS